MATDILQLMKIKNADMFASLTTILYFQTSLSTRTCICIKVARVANKKFFIIW